MRTPETGPKRSRPTNYVANENQHLSVHDAYGQEVYVGDTILVAMRDGNRAELAQYVITEVGTYTDQLTGDMPVEAVRAMRTRRNGQPDSSRQQPSILTSSLSKSIKLQEIPS